VVSYWPSGLSVIGQVGGQLLAKLIVSY